MNILHLIDSGGLYGAEMMLLNLVEEQINTGLSPIILSSGIPEIKEKPIEVEARKRKLPIYVIRMKAGFNIFQSFKILKFARQNKIDIIHSHGYKFNILLGMIPVFIRRITFISTLHGYTYSKFPSKKWLYDKLERISFEFIDGLVFVSEDIKQKPILKGLKAKNELVIINGIDSASIIDQSLKNESVSLFNFFPKSKKYIYLGAIGRLSQEKGFDLLVEAFRDLVKINQNIRLIIVGEGELRSKLEEKIIIYNLSEYIKLAGFINPIYRLMNELDGVIMPSYTEGLPITLLEACILNKSIVASSVGGIEEVLENYNRSIVIPPGNVDLLRNAIIDLFINKNNYNSTTKNWMPEKFDSKTMTKKYTLFYKRVLI